MTASRESFGRRLSAAIRDRGPLCVGVDPHPELLRAWDLPVGAAGIESFARTVVAAVGDRVAAVKPQSAFFEEFGSAGIAALERVLVDIRAAGALVVLDAKRGDIGSTMTAYARAYLADDAPLAADAVTLSPYLGFDSLAPAMELAEQTGRGVFVLALTSNPEGPQVQHARDAAGRPVAQRIADAAADRNRGQNPLGSIGLVVGATVGRTGIDLSRVNGPLLAPGIGAQGATAADLRTVFGTELAGVLPTSSREILRAGPSAAGLRAATDATVAGLRDALGPMGPG